VLSGTLEVESSTGRSTGAAPATSSSPTMSAAAAIAPQIGGPARVLFVHLPPEADLGA
jgi:hypothetical protein